MGGKNRSGAVGAEGITGDVKRIEDPHLQNRKGGGGQDQFINIYTSRIYTCIHT